MVLAAYHFSVLIRGKGDISSFEKGIAKLHKHSRDFHARLQKSFSGMAKAAGSLASFDELDRMTNRAVGHASANVKGAARCLPDKAGRVEKRGDEDTGGAGLAEALKEMRALLLSLRLAAGRLSELVKDLGQGLLYLQAQAAAFFGGMRDSLAMVAAAVIHSVGEALASASKGGDILGAVGDVFGIVESLITIGPALGTLLGSLGKLSGTLGPVLAVIGLIVGALAVTPGGFEALKEAGVAAFELIGTAINGFIEIFKAIWPIIDIVLSMIGEGVKTALGQFTDLFKSFSQIIKGVIDILVGIFTLDFKRVGDGIKSVFKGVINTVLGMFETFFNAIPNKINQLISGANNIADKLNLSIAIPKLPTITIPRLATGAVLEPNNPFLAIVGDQKHGTNVEAPLSTIEKAVTNAMGRGGGFADDVVVDLLQRAVSLLEKKQSVVLDTGTLVGEVTREQRRTARAMGR